MITGLLDLEYVTSFGKLFRVNDIVFTLMSTPSIVSLSPFIPIDSSDERSCYSTLLLYVPWPEDGDETQDRLYSEHDSSITRLAYLQSNNLLPPYVEKILTRIRHSENMLAKSGRPTIHKTTDTYSDNETNSTETNQCRSSSTSINSINDSDTSSSPSINEHQMQVCLQDTQSMISTENIDTTLVLTNMSYESEQVFKTFIRNALNDCLQKRGSANQIVSSDTNQTYTSRQKVNVENHVHRTSLLTVQLSTLKTAQKEAYDTITKYLIADDKQLLLFVTGEGGTGKSKLIELVMEFSRLHFEKQKGYYGACIAMAPTGSSANNIDGVTWQSALGKSRKNSRNGTSNMTAQCAKQVGSKLLGCKLAIIDEIGMISSSELYEISERIKSAKLAMTADSVERDNIQGN